MKFMMEKPVKDMTDRSTRITDENYHSTDLDNIADACTYLDKGERKKLYLLLKI